MKKIRLIVCLLLFLGSKALNGQDSAVVKRSIKFGAEYFFTTGFIYTHNLGAVVLIKNKHQIGLSGSFIPGEIFFKEQTNLGVAIDYNYLPNKTLNRFDLLFKSSITLTQIKNSYETKEWPNVLVSKREAVSKYALLFVGFGINMKLHKDFHLQASLSSPFIGYVAYYSKTIDYKYNTESSTASKSFYFIDPKEFMVQDLLAKIGLVYYFKR